MAEKLYSWYTSLEQDDGTHWAALLDVVMPKADTYEIAIGRFYSDEDKRRMAEIEAPAYLQPFLVERLITNWCWGIEQVYETLLFRFRLTPEVERFIRFGTPEDWENVWPEDVAFYKAGQNILWTLSHYLEQVTVLLTKTEAIHLRQVGLKLSRSSLETHFDPHEEREAGKNLLSEAEKEGMIEFGEKLGDEMMSLFETAFTFPEDEEVTEEKFVERVGILQKVFTEGASKAAAASPVEPDRPAILKISIGGESSADVIETLRASMADLGDITPEAVKITAVGQSGRELLAQLPAPAAALVVELFEAEGYAPSPVTIKHLEILSTLAQADLQHADLRGWDFSKFDLSEANLGLADLRQTNLNEANLHGAILNQANLNQTNFFQANLTAANLSQTDLKQTGLSEAVLKLADLSGADLAGTHLSKTELTEANLTAAKLSKVTAFEVILKGATLAGANLTEANCMQADLSQANLKAANLSKAILDEANLTEADLTGADLSQARLVQANLSQATLTGARLNEADLWEARLPSFDRSLIESDKETIWP